MSQDTVQLVNRLTPEMYRKLEMQLPKPHVGADASGEQAAFLLGIQAVLAKLRDGWVME